MLEHQIQGLNSKDQFIELGKKLEKRDDPRKSIRMLIRIAEWDGRNFPSTAEFREVETRDLATSGISYFDVSVPKSPSIVIMLGDNASPIYVLGRVAHCHECKWSRQTQWFIGCEFTDRVAPSAANSR